MKIVNMNQPNKQIIQAAQILTDSIPLANTSARFR